VPAWRRLRAYGGDRVGEETLWSAWTATNNQLRRRGTTPIVVRLFNLLELERAQARRSA